MLGSVFPLIKSHEKSSYFEDLEGTSIYLHILNQIESHIDVSLDTDGAVTVFYVAAAALLPTSRNVCDVCT